MAEEVGVEGLSGSLPGSGGLAGVPGSPRGSESAEEALSGSGAASWVAVPLVVLWALVEQAREDADGLDGEYSHRPPQSRPEVERLVAALGVEGL